MAKQRTLGRLALSFGIALAITKADGYARKRREKKEEELKKNVEDTTINIIVMEVEV